MNARTSILRRSLLALGLVLSGLVVRPASAASSQITTIVVLRHAEKATDDPNDPTLSPAGQERAQDLAKALDGAGISAVYVTEFRRTQLTAAPTAQRFGLTPEIRPAASQDTIAYAKALAARILSKNAGKSVLVVGHSNTVPAIVKALTGRVVAEIADTEFDRLYVVEVPKSGAARVVEGRYGKPKP
jgi:broad specificity phosphatase PhoE